MLKSASSGSVEVAVSVSIISGSIFCPDISVKSARVVISSKFTVSGSVLITGVSGVWLFASSGAGFSSSLKSIVSSEISSCSMLEGVSSVGVSRGIISSKFNVSGVSCCSIIPESVADDIFSIFSGEISSVVSVCEISSKFIVRASSSSVVNSAS